MSKWSIGLLVAGAMMVGGCAEPDTSSGTAEDDITGGSCGPAYGEANELYKEAVALAKQYNKNQCDATQLEIATKMNAAIDTCYAFRDVYVNSQWAAPVREALKSNFIDGIFRGESFDQALAGSTFYSIRLGVGPSDRVYSFGDDGQVTVTLNGWDEDAETWTSTDSVYSYTITAPEPGDDEMLGWHVMIGFPGGDKEFRLRRRIEDGADLYIPTYILQMVEDEENFLFSNPDECSA